MPDMPFFLEALNRLRRVSYFSSIVGCLGSASFTVFSLYTNSFELQLKYTPLQINYISIAGELGLYLCVPLIGWFADAYRLSYIGILSSFAYIIGYCGCAWVSRTGQNWGYMAFFFSVIGIACSASFISSLVNSARLFPGSALLSIAIPTTSYGVSSLMYAKLIGHFLKTNCKLDVLYVCLAILLCFLGILCTFAPIWGQVDKNQIESDFEVADDSLPVAENYIKNFFSDRRALLFLVAFVLVSGPLEAYQNNLGLLVKTDVSTQVAIFSTFSTLSRLIIGALTDMLAAQPSVLLAGVVLALSLTDLLYSLNYISLSMTSAICGCVYGASFTLFPLTISQVWGIKVFATYWGMFILGPAVGSLIFGLLFAHSGDSYANTFHLCALLTALAAALIAWLRLT